MYEIKLGNKFRKSFKRISRSGTFESQAFDQIISLLIEEHELMGRFGDHPLRGDSSDLRECHVAGDCLLIYKIEHENRLVRLIDIGNHANLFE